MFCRDVITEVDLGKIIAHFISPVTAIISITITKAQLTNIVKAPTLDGTLVEDGAGMLLAGTNCLGGMPTAEIDEYQVGAHFT